MEWPWKRGYGSSFKVIENSTIQKLGTISYSHLKVTMAVSCIISEIKQHIGRKSHFFHTLAFDAPIMGGGSRESRQNIAVPFDMEKN